MIVLDAGEIARRKPVWIALSAFYLDTELELSDIARIRSAVVESGYTKEQVLEINYDEVAPVVMVNTWSIAGEWAGFDEEWLVDSILKKLTQKGFKLRLPGLKWLSRKHVDFFSRKYLQQVFAEV